MRDTRLIFVEGQPGMGKTTTASWLAERLAAARVPVSLYPESQPGHPINVGGGLHPAGNVTGERFFQQYTSASFIQESLQRWQDFVSGARPTDAVTVLDSYPYQNSVRILLQMDAGRADIRAYAAQVEAIAAPLRPVLLYFSHQDTAQAIRHTQEIGERRGQAWMDYVATLVAQCPYTVARRLEGYAGVLAFMAGYQQLLDALLANSHLPRLDLGNCAGCWDGCYRRIETYLGLPD